MKKLTLIALLTIAIIFVSGCISGIIPILTAEFIPMDDTGVTPEKINVIVGSNNKFAIDYYNFIKDREESIIFFSNAIKHAPSSQPYGHSCEIPTI